MFVEPPELVKHQHWLLLGVTDQEAHETENGQACIQSQPCSCAAAAVALEVMPAERFTRWLGGGQDLSY